MVVVAWLVRCWGGVGLFLKSSVMRGRDVDDGGILRRR